MDFNSAWIFAKVVESGSFTAAARALHLPKSTVSKRVAELETSLSVTLLTRTTRSLQLTEPGREYYASCARAFAELDQARLRTTATQTAPQGLLRVTAPGEMAAQYFGPWMAEFMSLHPQVNIELVLSDRLLDLINDNIDVAIRAGELDDSTMLARALGFTQFRLYASPAYLKSHGAPRSPADLREHECLVFPPTAENGQWELISRTGGKPVSVPVRGRFAANSMNAIRAMAVAHYGIGLMPAFSVVEQIKARTLVPVMPGWSSDRNPVHLVYPRQRFVTPKQRAFVDFIVPKMRGLLGMGHASPA